MTYVLVGGIALLLALAAWQQVTRMPKRAQLRLARYGTGTVLALLTLLLALVRRIDLAFFTGAAAFAVFARGRIGPFSFETTDPEPNQITTVRSRFFAMALDHDSGEVAGKVTAGRFKGRDLLDLDEVESRALIAEVAGDADSVSLLESWLDANRSGWREYFAEQDAGQQAGPAAEGADPLDEAYAVLGLERNADAEAVRAAHRKLMQSMHPDRGGSSYLAARINEARDRILAHLGEA
jgi:hypothetical protein